MAGMEMKNLLVIALVVLVLLFIVYQYDPSLFGVMHMLEGFADKVADKKEEKKEEKKPEAAKPAKDAKPADKKDKFADGPHEKFEDKKEGFADLSAYEGPAQFGAAESPAGCYPRDQLTPSELLPKDMQSIWAQQNPMGPGSLKGKNFLSAGALIGVNTVGQSMRNANLQVRSEPPNPQMAVSIFNQSTISPDISHRPLEIGA
jgi:hypothetical protein